ncbi:MAG: ribosome small subunit-dependent GTPase A [Aquabacterium sp.]
MNEAHSLENDPAALRAIGATDADLHQAMQDAAPLRRVIEVRRDQVLLHDGHRACAARLLPALQHALRDGDDTLASGDWVLLSRDPGGGWWVARQLPARRQVSRRISDGNGGLRRQVLVSNVDTAWLVMGLDHDFNLRRLDRYLALAALSGLEAVLILSKADLVAPDQLTRRVALAEAAVPQGVPVFALDGRDIEATQALTPWLQAGRTVVLLGSSGAGKSTLTNSVAGQRLQDTGPVRADDSRGRHTTTARTLRLLPGGACVIDTPGLRALRLDVDDVQQLDAAFGDVTTAAMGCRFRDCRHQGEPGCAVREAVPEERLRSFHKLQREARRDSMTMLERREQLQQWKVRGRAGAARAKSKRSGA